jgi:hypothetical protein
MNKWIAIRVSAALTILGSVATLLFAGLMVWAGFFVPPPETAAESPVPLKGIMAALAVFFAAFGVWGFVTAAGVFRRRAWSRISMVIFAVLLVGMGGSALLGTLFLKLPPNASLTPQMMVKIRLGIAVLYGAMTVIGVWWLLLFNSSRSKLYFAWSGAGMPASVPPESRRPLSISIIGWYLLISALVTAAAGILRIPGLLFGAVLTGWVALAWYTVFTAVNLYLGTGLLQLQEVARVGSIVYFLLIAANSVVTMLLPDFSGRMRMMQDAFPRFLRWTQQQPLPTDGIWGFALIGALIAVGPIWLLVVRRAAFGAQAPRA